MAVASQGKHEFLDRIQRIEKRGVGVAEVFNVESTRTRRHIIGSKRPARQKTARKNRSLTKLLLALAIGALSFVVAQYATFRISDLPDLPEQFSNPDYVLIGQSGVALFLVFLCRMFFNLTAKTHMVLSVLGFAAAMSLMHNLVHLAPEPWAGVFSQGWVNELRSHTEMGTLYFRGHTIPLSQLSLG